jgi:hypothetical protein
VSLDLAEWSVRLASRHVSTALRESDLSQPHNSKYPVLHQVRTVDLNFHLPWCLSSHNSTDTHHPRSHPAQSLDLSTSSREAGRETEPGTDPN